MKTAKGYPLNEGNFESPEKIQSKIDFFIENPTRFDLCEWVAKDSKDLIGEINQLVRIKNSVESNLKELDEYEIPEEVINIRSELIALFRKYEDIIHQDDITVATKAVFGKNTPNLHRDLETRPDTQDFRFYAADTYIDWELIGSEASQVLTIGGAN